MHRAGTGAAAATAPRLSQSIVGGRSERFPQDPTGFSLELTELKADWQHGLIDAGGRRKKVEDKIGPLMKLW